MIISSRAKGDFMNYTIENIKEILILEISRMGKDFVLEEFMERFKSSIDKTITKIKGNYFLNNESFIIINDYMENENPRHFKNNQRESYSFAIKKENKVHCFDISITGSLITHYPITTLNNKNEIPSCFYVSDEDMNVLLFKKEEKQLIKNCDVYHDF